MGRPLVTQIIKDRLEQRGFILKHGDYNDRYSVLTIECFNGHVFQRSWDQLRRLKSCPQCNSHLLKREQTKKAIQSEMVELGYTDLSAVEGSKPLRISFRCDQGHKNEMTVYRWNSLKKCSICSSRGNTPYTVTEFKELLDKEGYTLIPEHIKNVKETIEIKCGHNHIYCSSIDRWNQGSRCPICSGSSVLTWDIIKVRLSDYGLVLLDYDRTTSDYLKSEIKIKCQAHSHTVTTTYQNLRSSQFKCKMCSFKNRVKLPETIETYIDSTGYTQTDAYTRSDDKMVLVCPAGHTYKVSWDNFFYNGRRCPRCGRGTSNIEKELFKDIESIYGGPLEIHDRQIIKPQELDVVLPSLKLAIELNGLFWHSELQGGKGVYYHLTKLIKCQQEGYKLLTIFEDEYRLKHAIVVSRLRSLLSNPLHRLHARKCSIRELSTGVSNSFLETNHLQGMSLSNYRIGAFYDDQLVAVMTFSKANLSRSFFKAEGKWELDRFAIQQGFHMPGIASKLLSFFERNQSWTEIISYADRRWSEGNLYSQLGFSLIHNTKPNYWYFKPNEFNAKRIHRFTLRKNKNDDPNLTEWENRQLQGYDRIWDCGNMKFIKYNKGVK